jgi:diadenosine tetraphosphate (Ap4A) HIT family hydrolase
MRLLPPVDPPNPIRRGPIPTICDPMETLIHQNVAEAREGRNPTVIARVRSGWAVLGDSQFIRGYSLLLPDPVVHSLNDLATAERIEFLLDMVALGDALLAVTDAYRVNYEIQGNGEPALHAHVFPRRMSEPDKSRVHPVWLYPESMRHSVPFESGRHRSLMDAICDQLQEAGRTVAQ